MALPLVAAIAANPAASGAIASGLASIGGSLLGRKKQKTEWDFEERRYLEKNRFKWLRRGAKRAGFNPLTVLGATGGQMAGVNPTVTDAPLGFATIAAKALADAGASYLSFDPIAYEQSQRNLELTNSMIDLNRSEAMRNVKGGGPVTASPPTDDGEINQADFQGPLIPPGHKLYPKVQVWGPAGGEIVLPYDIAERMRIRPGGTLTAGDLSEIVGELSGEVYSTLGVDGIVETLLGQGVILDKRERERLRLQLNRAEKAGDRIPDENISP